MVINALKAEAYRFSRNRLTAFWSVVFVPLMFAVFGVLYHVISKSKGDQLAAHADLPSMPVVPVNMADVLTFTADLGANARIGAVMMVFMLIAGAAVYAGDYRWETWRLITGRNDRLSLILGKVGVMKLLAIAATLVLLVASAVFFSAQALVYHRPVIFSLSASQAGDAALIWLLSYIRMVQFGLIGLLTAVLTRSMLATLFVPWALGFGQQILGAPPILALLGLKPDGFPAQLLLPGMAFDTLKNAVVPNIAQTLSTQAAFWPAAVSLALWIFVPLVAAVAWFNRQDLSKE